MKLCKRSNYYITCERLGEHQKAGGLEQSMSFGCKLLK